MLKLKPQWSLRELSDNRWSLTSEIFHQEVNPADVAILQKLVKGVEPDTLTDAEFTQIEHFTERGFLSIDTDPDAPIWELSGTNFHSVQEQFKHITFSVVDQTANGVGASLRQSLLTAGLVEVVDGTARLTLVVCDSYLDLPDIQGNVLPVVVNRMRLTIGPMLFPWRPNVRDDVARHEHYLPKPGYQLPPAFDALQRAWIAVAVLQFIGLHRLRYVKNFVEYNMLNQEFKLWRS